MLKHVNFIFSFSSLAPYVMVYIGETFQVGTKNAYCRSKRVIADTECNVDSGQAAVCPGPTCIADEENAFKLFAQTMSGSCGQKGLRVTPPTPAPTRFLCEEP